MTAELFEKFHNISSSPKARFSQYLKEGKKVVLTVPYYVPNEIIEAMGFVPMGVWGADIQLKRAKEYCPAFLCSIVQSTLELGIRGTYNGASAIVIPSLCDTLKSMGQNWKYAVPDIPFIPMTYPQKRAGEYGIRFTKAGYERVIRDLEKLGGHYTAEELSKANALYNRHNAVMRRLQEVLAIHPEVTASQRSDLFKSAFFMTAQEHTGLVEQLLTELENTKTTDSGAAGIPILVSGILTDAPQLNAVFDDLGMYIVADDVCAQSRQYRADTTDAADPLQALSEKFANTGNCSLLYDPDKKRVKWIVDTARERGARGVVVVMTKFCDPEEFDYVIIKRACEAADIPVTMIEVDRQMVQFEQVRTNLETFRDILMM